MPQHFYLTREAILKELTCDGGCNCTFKENDVVFTDFMHTDYCSKCFAKHEEKEYLKQSYAFQRADRELQSRMMDLFHSMYASEQR